MRFLLVFLSCMPFLACTSNQPAPLEWVGLDQEVQGSTSDGSEVTVRLQIGIEAGKSQSAIDSFSSNARDVELVIVEAMKSYTGTSIREKEDQFKQDILTGLKSLKDPVLAKDIVFLTFLVN